MHARSGLSLLEVLFSMGILLVGLMGVAAMIPAGRHEILQGTKVDHATAVGRAAIRDLRIREFHEPSQWRDSTGTGTVFSGGAFTSTGGYVAIDPLGLASGFGATFPTSAGGISLTRVYPMPQPSLPADQWALADVLFRNGDDLVFQPNATIRDGSPVQQLFSSAKRGSTGDYSWLATITPGNYAAPTLSPSSVSVAVFYKRDLTNPTSSEPAPLAVTFPGLSYSGTAPFAGSEVQVASPVKPLRPGQWVMLAGDIAVPAPAGRYARWFRVISAATVDPSTGKQQATLAGVEDWNVLPPSGNPSANPTQLWQFDGVIAVFERAMMLDYE